MKIVRTIFSPKAEQDIEDIGDYIFRDNPAAARRLVKELRIRCRNLREYPESGVLRPEIGPDFRSVPLGQYVIFYSVMNDHVRIQRIIHGARDLGHAMDR